MRLDQEARDALNGAMEQAHAECAGRGVPSRVIASKVVASVRDLERFGQLWVSPFLDDLAVVGAMKLCADWRRTHQGPGRTAKGTSVSVPAYTGTTDDEGQPVQAKFSGLDLPALQEKRARLAATRDTYSKEIRLVSDLIAVMEADPSVVTAGDALGVLMDAA